jgi:tape measure domain-containing protein
VAAGSGTIGIRLALQGTRAVVNGLGSVNGRIDRVAKSLEGLGKLIPFGGIIKGAGLAGAAIGGVASAAVVMGVKTAASMEQARISFTTMLGSAQEADSFIRDLQNFAAKTPFDFPGLQDAASSLLSAGIQADKIIPIMTSLGNATSGMGTGAEGVQRATLALQQMTAAGKISGEDLAQLRDAGIPVFDLLAAATGKSKDQVVALANAGKLGKKELDQLMTALESGKGLERFSGLMDKQSMSLSGLASTFQDTINMGLSNTVQPLIPMLKTLLNSASQLAATVLPMVTKQFSAWSTAAAPAIQRVADGISYITSNLKSGQSGGNLIANAFGLPKSTADAVDNFIKSFIAGLAGVTAALAPVWAGINAAPISVLQTVQWLLSRIAANPEAFSVLASAITTVAFAITAVRIATTVWTAVQAALNLVLAANPIGIIIMAIAALVGGIIYAYKNSETFRNVLSAVWDWIKKVAVVVFDLWMKFSPLGIIITTVAKNWDTITAAIGRFTDKVKQAWDYAKKLFDLIEGGDIQGAVNTVGNSILEKVGLRAEGGPVSSGSPYIVGEQGPELMVPKVSGTIINNRDLNAALPSMSSVTTVQPRIYLDGREISNNTRGHLAARAARA